MPRLSTPRRAAQPAPSPATRGTRGSFFRRQVRSLGRHAQAAAALLALAVWAAPPLVPEAEAQTITEVWSTTMTVGFLNTDSAEGYIHSSDTNHVFSSGGSLADDDFDIGGTTYTVWQLFNTTNGSRLYFRTVTGSPAAGTELPDDDELTLQLQSSTNAADFSTYSYRLQSAGWDATNKRYYWGTSVATSSTLPSGQTTSDTLTVKLIRTTTSGPDTTAPRVTSIVRNDPTTSLTKDDSLTWRVTFSENVQNVDAADFSVSGTTATVTTVTEVTASSVYDVTVSGGSLASLDGTVTLSFASGQNIADIADNALSDTAPTGTNANTYVLDNTAPTVTSIVRQTPSSSPTNADTLTWRFTFSEGLMNGNELSHNYNVSGTTATLSRTEVTASVHDLTASGGNLAGLNATVSLVFDAVRHSFLSNAFRDAAGNLLTDAMPTGTNDNTWVVDNTAPTVAITGVPGMSTAPFTATFTFSEDVTGFTVDDDFTEDDIEVGNGAASAFTETTAGTAFTALITPAAAGTVTVDVAADAATDEAGNGNTAAVQATSIYTVTDPCATSVTDQVWCGAVTMNTDASDTEGFGYIAAAHPESASFGSLSDDDFEFDGTTYTVWRVTFDTNRTEFDWTFAVATGGTLTEFPAANLNELSVRFSDFSDPTTTATAELSAATYSAGNGYRWVPLARPSGFNSWGIGDTAAVRLIRTTTNTPPTAADNTVTTVQDTAYTFAAEDFGFTDADTTNDMLASVRIESLPVLGTLALNGTAVSLNDVIPSADIAGLTFTPVAGATGDGYATFTFKVNDGTDFSAVANTMTIDVTLPPITIEADRATATGKVDWIHYTLTRAGDTAAALTVTVTFEGPASNDWSLDPAGSARREVTFAADSATAEQSIRLISGFRGIGFSRSAITGGTLTAGLGATAGYDTSDTDAVDVVVINGPAWVVKLAEDHYRFDEDGGDQDIELVATAASAAVPAPSLDPSDNSVLTYSVTTTGDTASPVVDFAAITIQGSFPSSGACTADAGNVQVCRANETFTPVNDADAEPDETLELNLGPGIGGTSAIHFQSPDGTTSDSTKTYTVTIVDDDTSSATLPVVTIAPGTSPVMEGAAATFTLSRTEATTTALTVSVSVSERGGDMVASAGEGTKTISFGAGQATATLSVPTVDDQRDESDSVVTATVLADTGDPATYLPGVGKSASVTVSDDESDSTNVLTIRQLGTPSGSVCADLSGPDAPVAGAICLGVWFNGIDPAGFTESDIEIENGTLANFRFTGSNDTVQRITVNVTGNTGDELVFRIVRGALDAGNAEAVYRRTITGGPATLTMSSSASEPVSGNFSIDLEFTHTVAGQGDGGSIESVRGTVPEIGSPRALLTYQVSNGSLVRYGNFSVRGDKSFDLVVSPRSNFEGRFSLVLLELQLQSQDAPGVWFPEARFGIGVDTKPPTLETVELGDNGRSLYLTFHEEPVAGSLPTISDFRVVAGGNTVALVSPVALAGKTVTFGLSDAIAPGADSTVSYVLPPSSRRLKDQAGNETPAFSRKVDTGPPEVTIVPGTSPVTEGENAAAAFTLSRTGDTSDALTVNVSVAETGDMIAAADEGSQSVSFEAGSATAVLNVPVQDDDIDEIESEVTAELVADTSAKPAHVLGTSTSATVTVEDDDHPNMAPTGSAKTVTVAEDGTYTFAVSDFDFTDTDGGALASVTIVTPPASGKGTLELSGTAVAADEVVPATSIGNLVYTPPADANGTGYASFTFKVSDGTDVSAAAYTMTIDVTQGNDPATGEPTISGIARVGRTLTVSTAGIMDVDGLPSTFSYQWRRKVGATTTSISGANSRTYILHAADFGNKVAVRVSFTDLDGNPEMRTSGDYPTSGTVQADNSLVSNVGQSATNAFALSRVDLAQSFRTGPNLTGYTVSSIDLKLDSADSTNTPTVKLYSGSANGTEEATFTGPAMLDASSIKNYAFTPSSTAILRRETTYWVVAEGAAKWVLGGTREDATPAMGWSIFNNYEFRSYFSTGGFTTDPAAEVLQIRVNGILGGIVLSTDATLSALALEDAADDSAITISPAFVSGTTSYTADVDNGVDEITITPTVNESNATVEYLDSTDTAITDADSGKAGHQVSLAVGANTIKVTVTAEDTTTTNPYTVAVTRARTPPTSANQRLLILEDDDYTFHRSNFSFDDTDGDSFVSVKIVTLPASGTGTLSLSDTTLGPGNLPQTVPRDDLGDLTYSPPANAHGTDFASFTFKVNDGTHDSDSAYTMTITVLQLNDPATGEPTISGTAREGQTLTVSTVGIMDVDGLPSTYTYQWVRLDSDGNYAGSIRGEMASTYTLTTADVGNKVFVEVSFHDVEGGVELRSSAAYPATGVVVAVGVASARIRTVPANWALKPADIAAGEQFRLMFATSTFRNARSTNIIDYNTFVGTRATAGLAALQTYAGDFTALVSTESVNARANTLTRATDTDAPVYWVRSSVEATHRAADDYADFFDGSWATSWRGYNESGSQLSTTRFWTGSNTNGTTHATQFMGPTGATASAAQWVLGDPDLEVGATSSATENRIVALSPVFQVANTDPTVATAILDQTATAGTAFNFVFLADTFTDADSDPLTYEAIQSDDSALPAWLSFDAATRTFSGTPADADVGTVSVKVTASDSNGGSVSATFDIVVSPPADTTAPTVTSIVRQTPTSSPTNADSLTWRVTFTENVKNVDAADFAIGGTTASVTDVTEATASTVYDVTASGGDLEDLTATVTLSFAGGQDIADTSDNVLSDTAPTGTNDDTYVVNNTAPTVASIVRQTPSSSPTNADSLTWRVTFSEDVKNVDATDFAIIGTTATVTDVTEATASTVYDVTASGGNLADLDATVTLSFAGGQNIADNADNVLSNPAPTGTNDDTYVVNNTAPTVASIVRQTPSSSPTNADSLTWRVTFSENVKNVDATDFAIIGTTATVTDVTEATASTVYDVTASGGNLADLDATVTLSFAGGRNIADNADNALSNTTPTGTNDDTYVLDNTAPTVTSIERQTPTFSPTNADSLTWRVTFNENVKNVDAADFAIGGTTATVTNVTEATASTVYDVTVSGGDLADLDATVTLSFAGGQDIADNADNALSDTAPTGANDTSYVVDNTAPTVTITVPPTSSAAFTATFTFSEDVTGFVANHITVGNGTASAFTATTADRVYTVSITPTANGAVTVDVAADAATDEAGNDNTAATQATSTYTAPVVDTTAPRVASIVRQTPTSSPTNADSLTWRVTFSEDVKNVDAADFAIGGTTASVTDVTEATASTVYDVTASGGDLADLDATVTLSFAGGQDIADNADNALSDTVPTGTNDNTWVVDNTAPTVASIVRQTPTSSPTNADSLTWRVTFSEDVKNVDAADFAIGGTTASVTDVTVTTASTVYDVTASGGNLASLGATVTLSFAGGQDIADNADNVLSDTAPAGTNDDTWVVDNTAPTVASIVRQTPTSSPTNADSLTWRVTFSEDVKNVDAADFAIAGTTATVTDVTEATASTVYDVTASGGNLASLDATVTLSIASSRNIADTSDNALSDTVPTGTNDNTWVVDNTAPTVASIVRQTPTSSPTNADSLTWRVTFSEDVKNVDAADFAIGGTTASVTDVTVTTASTVYDVTASGGNLASLDATVTLSFAGGQDIADNADNALSNPAPAGTNDSTWVVDNTVPTVAITGVPPTSSAAFTATFTFSEDVTGFVASDITVGNGTASAFTATTADRVYTASITPTASGEVTVDVAVDAATDAAGNGNPAATRATSTYTAPPVDNTAPRVASIVRQTPSSSPTNADSLIWRVTFTENVKNVDAADFAIAGTTATVTDVTVATASTVYDVTASGGNLASLDATVTLSLAGGQDIADTSDNALSDPAPTGTNDDTYVVDNAAPTVTITGVPGTSSEAFTATFTFSEAVTGFVVGEITLGNATASNFTATSTTVYTALITPTANGAVTVDVAADAATDAAGNGNTAAAQASSTYTMPVPTITIAAGTTPVTEGASAAFTLTRSGGPPGNPELTVNVSVTETEDMVAAADKGARTVTFQANSATAMLGVATVADSVDETNSVVTATVTANPAAYTVGTSSSATVTVTDDDTRGVTVSAETLAVNEGSSGTYTVVLDSEPTVSVTVTPSSGNSDVTVSSALTFTTVNWSTAQTVTVTAAHDGDAVDDSATISHAVAGGDYGAVTAVSVAVTVDDDETADTTAPRVASIVHGTPSSSPTNADSLTWRVTFSEAVSNVDTADFAVSGTNATLSVSAVSGVTGAYDVTASGGNLAGVTATVTLSIAAGHDIQDAASNALTNTTPTGTDESDYVVDNTAPTVAITGVPPTSSAAFTATFTFSEDVTGFVASDITVGNGTASAFTATTADRVYTASITPTANGEVTVDVAADAATDEAGNGNTAATRAASNYTAPVVDTTAPRVASIVRRTPSSSPTNANSLKWRIAFTENVKNVDSADFAIGGTTASLTVTVVTASTVYDVTASGGDLASLDATVTLSFASSRNIADTSDNALSNPAPTGANDNTYVVDNTAPTVTITDVPPTSSAAFTATFTFSEAVTGFAVGDITLDNASASNFTATSTTVYTALITPTANGAVTVDVAADAATDAASNGNTAATQASSNYTGPLVDTIAPRVASIVRQTPTSSPTNADSLTWRVAFNENVKNVDATDFAIGGTTATVTAVTEVTASTVYDVTASGGNLAGLDATVTLSFASGRNIADIADNALSDPAPTGTNHNTWVVDNTAPTVAITGVPPASSAAFTATFTFSEAVTGFVVGDITLGNATASNFTDTSTTVYTTLITPTADGEVTVDVAADAATDAAGNGNPAATRVSSTYTVVTAPGEPESLTARTGDTQVTLIWTPPVLDGGAPIESYQYRHSAGSAVASGADWMDAPDANADGSFADERSVTVTGLDNGRQYAFEVRAVNSAALNGPAARAVATPVRPPLPPGTGFLVGNFGQTADGAAQIYVTHDIVGVFTTGARGADLHNIELRLFTRRPNIAVLPIPSVTLYRASVTDSRATRGERVAALTAAPESSRSTETAQTVAFNAPDDTGLDAGTTYLVLLEHTSYVRAEATTSPAEDAGGARGWEIDGIGAGNNSPYSYGTTSSLLMRVNGTPAGPTVATAPEAPASLVATADDAQVTLSWTPPGSDGGAGIEKYQYRYSAVPYSADPRVAPRVDPETAWTDVPDGSDTGTSLADERSVSVTELDNGRQYAFELRAVNSVRAGAAATATAMPAAPPRTGFLVSNFGQPVDGTAQIAPLRDIVGVFTTGALGATFGSIEFRLSSALPGTAPPLPPATLYHGSVTDTWATRATRGERVATLTAAPGSPGLTDTAQTIAFNAPESPDGTRLEANTMYLVVLSGSAYVRVESTDSSDQDAGGASGWTIDGIGVGNSSPWSYWTSMSLLMSVNTAARETTSRQLEAPVVEGAPVVGEAGTDGVWTAGETVEVQLTFSEPVTVDITGGTPSIDLRLGTQTQTHHAQYTSGSGTNELVFGYTLAEDEGPHATVLVPGDSLVLNGGTIVSAADGTVDADLAHAGAAKAALVSERAERDVADRPLTATLTHRPGEDDVLGEHKGSGTFEVRLAFNTEPEVSHKTVRDTMFDVTGGTITGARRVTGGKPQHFDIVVKPSGSDAVTFSLHSPLPACGETGSVCTEAGRMIEGPVSATVLGPVAISVADASVTEGADAVLAFEVTLDRASSAPVTVDYATGNGTATAGEDYVAQSGDLTFAAGETAKTVEVEVLDDLHDEGTETMTLTLSNPSGARIADATATGSIENTDHMPKAWMVRFGRTVGSQVVDALGQRLAGGQASHVTVAGIPLTGGAAQVPDDEVDDVFGLPEWAKRARREEEARTITADDLRLRSTFHLSSGSGEPGEPAFTTWGWVSTGGFSAQADDVTTDGDVTTGLLGFDAEWDNLLAGVMLSQSTGEGAYRPGPGQSHDAGTVKSDLTGVYPYARINLDARVSAWALAGAGSGSITLTRDWDDAMKTDLSMRMGALGVQGQVLDGTGPSGMRVNLKSDAMWVGTKSARSPDMVGSQGDVLRLRLVAQGERDFTIREQGTLTPSAELGLRHDGGDAETGMGVELGAGLRYMVGSFTIEARARTLVAHESSGFEEWGASAAIGLAPGASGRGLSLSIAPTWGRMGSASEWLWSARDAGEFEGGGEFEADGRIEVQMGYGFALPHDRGLLTPYGALTFGSEGGRTMRGGARWLLDSDLAVTLDATRTESAGAEAGNHVRVQAALRF